MDASPARAARIDAPLLNARLSKAQDASELLDLFDRHGWQVRSARPHPLPRKRLALTPACATAQMDGMHYGNLWNKLGRQLRESSSRQEWVAQHDAPLERLVSATTAHLRTCGAQPLANIAHGAAHIGLPPALAGTLFSVAAAAAEPGLARWAPRHLANLAWACAQSGYYALRTSSTRATYCIPLAASLARRAACSPHSTHCSLLTN